MKRLDQIAVELALMQDIDIADTFRKIIARERSRFISFGLDDEEAKVCAFALAAAAYSKSEKIGESAADASRDALAEVGFTVD